MSSTAPACAQGARSDKYLESCHSCMESESCQMHVALRDACINDTLTSLSPCTGVPESVLHASVSCRAPYVSDDKSMKVSCDGISCDGKLINSTS